MLEAKEAEEAGVLEFGVETFDDDSSSLSVMQTISGDSRLTSSMLEAWREGAPEDLRFPTSDFPFFFSGVAALLTCTSP